VEVAAFAILYVRSPHRNRQQSCLPRRSFTTDGDCPLSPTVLKRLLVIATKSYREMERPMAIHYVFGYGSLINSESRARTGRSGMAIPARVTGVQRIWNFVDRRTRMTALGVVRREESVTNGTLVSVPAADLLLFDRREGGYTRTRLDHSRVIGWDGQRVRADAIWIYLPNEPGWPSQDCPIAQSYVDVVLVGCLEVEGSFAAEFVRTTTNWGYPWVDDRSAPRYLRAMQNVPPAKSIEIDRILLENGVPLRGRVSLPLGGYGIVGA
jgi:cation transport regulator ChaC